MGEVKWKGKTVTVELDLHKASVRQYMRESGKTYSQVMDDIFDMLLPE